MKINVVESISVNPLYTVGCFHSTPVFGAWLANGIWHAYPDLTGAGIAITTPKLLRLRGTPANNDHFQAILHKYMARGFTYSLNEYSTPHHCGVDMDCPATARHSDDDGCLFVPFPDWTLSDQAVVVPRSSWSLGGHGCSLGVLMAPSHWPRFFGSAHSGTMSIMLGSLIDARRCRRSVGHCSDGSNCLLRQLGEG